MNQPVKLDLNFKHEDVIKAAIETLSYDSMDLCTRRSFVQRALIYRRERIYNEYKKELSSYEKLYSRYKEGDKVPKKVNNKILKINRMVKRLKFLDRHESRVSGYIPYDDYFPILEEILKKILI